MSAVLEADYSGRQVADQLRSDAAKTRKPDRDDQSWLHDNPDKLGFPFTWARDYPEVKALDTIVAGLIEAGTLAMLYGESNTGKSTFALDIALSLAQGATWRGRKTREGVVLWIALESAAGLRRRVIAHRQHYKLGGTDLLFVDVTANIQLLDVSDVQRILDTIEIIKTTSQKDVVMVVVDTVARALAGGDENDGRDMGSLIRGCDMIRQATGAAVLLIHHSGKDSTRGARGHSSLRAAVDTEIEITGQVNPRQAKVTKQRDLPNGDTFVFDLEPVEIGTDAETGEAITACVVVHRDDVYLAPAAPKGKAQTAILKALRSQQAESKAPVIWTLEDMRKIGRNLGQHKSTARGAVDGLVCSGFLTATIGGHRLADGAE